MAKGRNLTSLTAKVRIEGPMSIHSVARIMAKAVLFMNVGENARAGGDKGLGQ